MAKNIEPTPSVKHITDGIGKHAIVVNDLRVMLLKDGDNWFAQGLDIDYASAGATVDEAKKNFETGFAKTIKEYLVMYGNLSKFMQSAPEEVWQEFLNPPPETQYLAVSSVQLHNLVKDDDLDIKLPFGNIAFLKQTELSEITG